MEGMVIKAVILCICNDESLTRCYQMSTQSESDVSLEDLRLPQLVSPRWSDDESVDSLQQPASPPHIDRSANSDAGCIILLNVLMELKALIIIIKYKQEIRSVELRICPMQLFNF